MPAGLPARSVDTACLAPAQPCNLTLAHPRLQIWSLPCRLSRLPAGRHQDASFLACSAPLPGQPLLLQPPCLRLWQVGGRLRQRWRRVARRCHQAPAVMPRRLLACLLPCPALQIATPTAHARHPPQTRKSGTFTAPPALRVCVTAPRACCRRPFLPYSTFLFFPLVGYGLYGYGSHYAPAIDAQRTVIFNNQTMANVRCASLISLAALAWSSGSLKHWPGVAWQHLRCSAVLPVCLRTACCRPAPSVRPLPACVPSCLQRRGAAG